MQDSCNHDRSRGGSSTFSHESTTHSSGHGRRWRHPARRSA